MQKMLTQILCHSNKVMPMVGKVEAVIQWLFQQDRNKEFEVREYKQKRSLDQNRLLWGCIGDIATALRADKWDIYLAMLKRYGKFTYICVKPNVVEAIKKQWRESEEIGEIEIGGEKAVQMLCYFGSSTYNSKEMSVLLDGIISEMKEMELPTPSEKELDRVIKQMEKNDE